MPYLNARSNLGKTRRGTRSRKSREMSYYPRGADAGDDEDVDNFDEYDPTPYGGGYDLSITYGRPLSPSEQICYPVFSSDGGDYDRPQYGDPEEPASDSGSGYGGYGGRFKREDDEAASYGYVVEKHRPEVGYGEEGYDRKKRSEYGYGRSTETPDYERQQQEEPWNQVTYGRSIYGGSGEEEEGSRKYRQSNSYDPDQGEAYDPPTYGNYEEEKRSRQHYYCNDE